MRVGDRVDRAPAVGQSVLRVEDGPLLTGRACFVDDADPVGLLHARFLRSPLAHATIVRVDLRAAASAAGVEAALAARDLALPPLIPPIENEAAFSPPRPLLAEQKVRFVGEPVAVVAAETPYAAEDAAELIELELDPLEVISDPVSAAEASAPALHENGSNVLFESRLETGEVDAAFEAAAVEVERSFVNPRYSAMPIEPRVILAEPDGVGLRVLASTQAPHRLRAIIAQLLDLAPSAVRVECAEIGGGFGQKCHAYPEDIVVCALALRLRRPVRWTEDRSENLLASSHARDQRVRVRAAADAEGRLLAIDADVICDTGAYGVYPHGHILEALGTPAMIPGPYRLPAYRARSRSVTTNKCPEGAYRGVGLPVSAFVHERMMDVLAHELGVDRAEIRRRNLVAMDEMPYTTLTNQRYDSGDYAAALDAALTRIRYEEFAAERKSARADGRLLGLGFSCYVEYTGINSQVFRARGMIGIAGFDGAHVTIGADGRARVWTTLPGIGQGVATTFAQIAADRLGVEVGRVVVEPVDTAVGELDGTGAFASRSAVSGGGAVIESADEVRHRLLDDASRLLEAPASELEIDGDAVRVRGSEVRNVAISRLIDEADPARYRVSSTFDPPAVAYPYATHACIVEVDPEIGEVRVRRYVIVEDCGRVINPPIVDGQVHGATAQGLGGTMFESLAYDGDGQLQSASLLDYLVPTAAEVPELEVSHLETPAPEAPNGAKGVGEGGTLAPPGALANAVSDALDVEINELPITPERVRAAAAGRLEASR
ncbi:MAG: xanthine dehydrogenase family protein molybdopterin-binding subunit [Solirubrobacterales bacterium]